MNDDLDLVITIAAWLLRALLVIAILGAFIIYRGLAA